MISEGVRSDQIKNQKKKKKKKKKKISTMMRYRETFFTSFLQPVDVNNYNVLETDE